MNATGLISFNLNYFSLHGNVLKSIVGNQVWNGWGGGGGGGGDGVGREGWREGWRERLK